MKTKDITRHLLIALFFAIIANSTYISCWSLYEDDFTTGFFIMRFYMLVHMYAYAYTHYYLITKWIDKKISFGKYLILFHLLLLVTMIGVLVIGAYLTSYLYEYEFKWSDFNIGYMANITFYYYTYINILAGIVFLPRLISRYKFRNKRLEIETQEQKALSLQTNLFTQLFSKALTAIKNQADKEKRERQIIQLSDFLRFLIYESDEANITMSKVQLILNLYAKIIRSSYQNMELQIINEISKTHLHLSTKKLLFQLQKFTQHTINNNTITKAQLKLFTKQDAIIFDAQLFSASKQEWKIEEIVS